MPPFLLLFLALLIPAFLFLLSIRVTKSKTNMSATENSKLKEKGKGKGKEKHQAIKPHALKVPGLVKLSGKRVVLASASPRRKDILATFVCGVGSLVLGLVELMERILLLLLLGYIGDRLGNE